MPNNKDIGVITEQGFVAGDGLGFSPIKENELSPKDKPDDKGKEKKNS